MTHEPTTPEPVNNRHLVQSVILTADPGRAWDLVSDLDALASWFPEVASSHLDGDIRHVVLSDSRRIRHRIIQVDHDLRSYSYEHLDGPWGANCYTAEMKVFAYGSGSRVVWHADLAADDLDSGLRLADALTSLHSTGLRELGRLLAAQQRTRTHQR